MAADRTPPVYRPRAPALLADARLAHHVATDRRQVDPLVLWNPSDPRLRFWIAASISFALVAVYAWLSGRAAVVFVGSLLALVGGAAGALLPWLNTIAAFIGAVGCFVAASSGSATPLRHIGLFVCLAVFILSILLPFMRRHSS